MYEPYIGEVRMYVGFIPPWCWLLCNGQEVAISSYPSLYSLLGLNFGGNGRTTFAVPDLRDASPVGAGTGPGLTPFRIGQRSGSRTVTLQASEMPAHTHALSAVDALGTSGSMAGAVWAQSGRGRVRESLYGPAQSTVAMSGEAVTSAGGTQPHENMPPYQVVNFWIAWDGLYPPRE